MDSIESRKACTTRNIELIGAKSVTSSENKLRLIEQDLDSFFSSDAFSQSTFPAKSIAINEESPRDTGIQSSWPSATSNAEISRSLRPIRICERFESNAYDRETISLTDLLVALEHKS